MSLCLYHSTHCAHGDASKERYLVRLSGLYADEFRFDFADLAETFAASAAGKDVQAEVIDTVTGLVIKKYGSVPRRESALVATCSATPGSLRVTEQRQRMDSATDDDGRLPRRLPSVADSIR